MLFGAQLEQNASSVGVGQFKHEDFTVKNLPRLEFLLIFGIYRILVCYPLNIGSKFGMMFVCFSNLYKGGFICFSI
jgi:hypothetical protein